MKRLAFGYQSEEGVDGGLRGVTSGLFHCDSLLCARIITKCNAYGIHGQLALTRDNGQGLVQTIICESINLRTSFFAGRHLNNS